MKKIISVLFAASLMFVVFACAPKTDAPVDDSTQIEEVTEEQTEETVPVEETAETPADEVAE